jgi:hypothetical protein
MTTSWWSASKEGNRKGAGVPISPSRAHHCRRPHLLEAKMRTKPSMPGLWGTFQTHTKHFIFHMNTDTSIA